MNDAQTQQPEPYTDARLEEINDQVFSELSGCDDDCNDDHVEAKHTACLLATIKADRVKLSLAVEALTFYANKGTWTWDKRVLAQPVFNDFGAKAEAALERIAHPQSHE